MKASKALHPRCEAVGLRDRRARNLAQEKIRRRIAGVQIGRFEKSLRRLILGAARIQRYSQPKQRAGGTRE
jgi:hypothetical protein